MDAVLTRTAHVVVSPIGHIVLTPTHVDTNRVDAILAAAGATSLDFGWSYRDGYFGEALYSPDAMVADVLAAHGWSVTSSSEHVGMVGTSIDLSDEDLAGFARDFDRHVGGAL